MGTGRWLREKRARMKMDFTFTTLTQRSGAATQACSLCDKEKVGGSLMFIGQGGRGE